jgi:hypothetical protein
MGVNMNGVALR